MTHFARKPFVLACVALSLGLTALPVQAGVFGTPTGGWGVIDPADPDNPRPPRPFGSTAGGSPNV